MNQKNKFMLAAVLLALLLTVAVSGSLAYLIDLSGPVENVFTPTKVPPEVTEGFEDNVKSSVAIKNNGNIDAYLRAAVVITWQDGTGNVYGKLPVADEDYFIKYGTSDNWVKSSDGFWYYTKPVAAQDSTDILITECMPLRACEDETYTLCVEILAQSVQAEPRSVVTSVWDSGVSAANEENGKLTIIKQ